MAGYGNTIPKDPAKRARRNKDTVRSTTLRFEKADAPELPVVLATDPQVVRWWNVWVESPQADHFGTTDWLYLLETAYIAAAFYGGDMKVAPELRLRQAKFGATPEDRLRLRMQFAAADEADAKRPKDGSTSAKQYGDLRVVEGSDSEVA